MFDTININLRSIDTQQLNFVKTVTRDLNVDTTTSRYGTTYTSHIDNLTIQQQMDYPSATAVFASSFTGTILSTLRGLIPDLHLKNCPTRCISR